MSFSGSRLTIISGKFLGSWRLHIFIQKLSFTLVLKFSVYVTWVELLIHYRLPTIQSWLCHMLWTLKPQGLGVANQRWVSRTPPQCKGDSAMSRMAQHCGMKFNNGLIFRINEVHVRGGDVDRPTTVSEGIEWIFTEIASICTSVVSRQLDIF